MSPRKLTQTDKSDILNLYRRPEETTSTLAVRYGVSNSTISRILKSTLVESEYEVLIQQKRSNRTPGGASSSLVQSTELPQESEAELPLDFQEPEPTLEPETDPEPSRQTSSEQRRRRKRSSVALPPVPQEQAVQTQLPLEVPASVEESGVGELDEPLGELDQAETSHLEQLLDEDLRDLADDDDDDDDDDDLEDDLEDGLEDDWEDEGIEAEIQKPITHRNRGINVQVLPLSEASLPRTCYLVVDRAAELIARPLKEFSDLGQIPIEEVHEKTLPVFDNHRVARRFSNRSQRVIKVPDGRMLQKTCSHLQAKGITRLLIDGQVYSLLPAQP
jgi:transposase-like protein